MCEKYYIWNPSTCTSENGKYLESITGDSVITCDEIIEVTKTVPKKSVLTKCNPTKTLHMKTVLTKTVTTKTVPTKSISMKTIPTIFNGKKMTYEIEFFYIILVF